MLGQEIQIVNDGQLECYEDRESLFIPWCLYSTKDMGSVQKMLNKQFFLQND